MQRPNKGCMPACLDSIQLDSRLFTLGLASLALQCACVGCCCCWCCALWALGIPRDLSRLAAHSQLSLSLYLPPLVTRGPPSLFFAVWASLCRAERERKNIEHNTVEQYRVLRESRENENKSTTRQIHPPTPTHQVPPSLPTSPPMGG